MKVQVTTVLAHPRNPMVKLLPCEARKDLLIQELGEVNYAHAVQQGWFVETGELDDQ